MRPPTPIDRTTLAALIAQARLFACLHELAGFIREIEIDYGAVTANEVVIATRAPARFPAENKETSPMSTQRTRSERLGPLQTHELVEKGRAIRHPLVEDGYYAGRLAATIGSSEMERLRTLADRRDDGKGDWYIGLHHVNQAANRFGAWLTSISNLLNEPPHDPRSAG